MIDIPTQITILASIYTQWKGSFKFSHIVYLDFFKYVIDLDTPPNEFIISITLLIFRFKNKNIFVQVK